MNVDPDVQKIHGQMIDRLAKRGYIRTPRVEAAFRSVYRHRFLPDVPFEKVYSGEAIPTRYGPDDLPISSSSEPAIMAVMVEQLQLQAGNQVLEIGAGTGYNAAILAYLVETAGNVTTVDIDEEIVRVARENLASASFHRVRVLATDGWLGVPHRVPYDRIEATVGVWDLSPHWMEQLREDGILVVPLWLRPGVEASIAFQKHGDALHSISVEPAGFMRLRGSHSGPERYVRVNEWTALVDEVTPHTIGTLRDLLESTPRVEMVPTLPQGWFTRMALEASGVISLGHRDDWRHVMGGIFDAAQRSLAVVEGRLGSTEGGRILVFGADAALLALRKWITSPRPLDLRNLHVMAAPSTRPLREHSQWLFYRPFFQFGISERTPGGSDTADRLAPECLR